MKKQQVIAAALVLALGAAVYVNWQFNGRTDTAKELGAASYVNATVSPSTADEAARAGAMTKEQQDYFAAERTARQAAQDKITDEAREMFDAENASEEQKNEAQKTVAELLKSFTVQSSIESIIKAKGFYDCLCCISGEGVTVIVPKEQLNETAALVINDAVTSHYKTACENISIVGA